MSTFSVFREWDLNNIGAREQHVKIEPPRANIFGKELNSKFSQFAHGPGTLSVSSLIFQRFRLPLCSDLSGEVQERWKIDRFLEVNINLIKITKII